MMLGPTLATIVMSRMTAKLVSLDGDELVDDELVATALCVRKQR